MSMNEELQSANEELESSKEELQSLNEELSTLNSQLQDKIADLERSHNDIANLLASTDISTVFLDTSMCVKLFTPSASRLLNLRQSDIGRPLADFAPNVCDDGLLVDAQIVLEGLVPVEKQVVANDGRHFLRRIQPYRTREQRIDGVVITFVDITGRAQVEEGLRRRETALKKTNALLEQRVSERTAALEQREAELRTLAANVPAMFSYVGADEVYRYANRLYERHHGLPEGRIVGRSVRDLLGAANYALAKPHIDRALRGETDRYEATFAFADGVHSMDVVLVPETNPDGDVKGFYTLVHDITERKALEREIIEIATAEQERIGRDIQDGIGQQLTAVTMLAGSVQRRLDGAQRPEEAKSVGELVGNLRDTLAQTWTLARGLAPVEIAPEGLAAALADLIERVRAVSGVDCRFLADPVAEASDSTRATHLYRIAQEALSNAIKHGQPRHIEVLLRPEEGSLVLSVYDDGIGVASMETGKHGLGVHIMRYRAGIVGGQLTVDSPERGGTLVRCRCPLQG